MNGMESSFIGIQLLNQKTIQLLACFHTIRFYMNGKINFKFILSARKLYPNPLSANPTK